MTEDSQGLAASPRSSLPLAGSTAVLVLGMHRSGTSAVSGALHQLGVSLGRTVSPSGPSNPRGYFENTRVMLLHEELLASLGSSWDDPRPLPPRWWEEPPVATLADQLRRILGEEFGGAPLWGVKDPRLCRLLPLWRPLLAELEVRVVAVLVLRHPAAVAASNAARTAMAREQALELWLEHTLLAERETRTLPRTVVSYDHLLADWRKEMDAVARRLELSLPFDAAQGGAQVAGLLEKELRHFRAETQPRGAQPFQAWAERTWETFLAWHESGRLDTRALDELAEERARWAGAALPVRQYLEGKLAACWHQRARGVGDVAVAQAAARAEEERLAAENRRLAHDLTACQRQKEELASALSALTATRWFRLASRYWSLRERLRSGAPR